MIGYLPLDGSVFVGVVNLSIEPYHAEVVQVHVPAPQNAVPVVSEGEAREGKDREYLDCS